MVAAPSAPSPVTFPTVTATSLTFSFTDGSNNGSAIDARQIGYGNNSSTPQVWLSCGNTGTISGLITGTTYYFWAQTHNALGWSPLSARSSVTMLRVPDSPSSPVITNITQTSLTATFNTNGDGGAPIDAYQIGWGTDPAGPTYTDNTTFSKNILGLDPGTTYYVWARAHNSAGWSNWSVETITRTIAGARLKVGAVYKEAVPYVRDGGVWKLARPWGRIAGVWKESI